MATILPRKPGTSAPTAGGGCPGCRDQRGRVEGARFPASDPHATPRPVKRRAASVAERTCTTAAATTRSSSSIAPDLPHSPGTTRRPPSGGRRVRCPASIPGLNDIEVPHAANHHPPPPYPTASRRRARRTFTCQPCRTAWPGAESDCPSCGNPATGSRAHPRSALYRALLTVPRKETRK
jgi:hypothetical protein